MNNEEIKKGFANLLAKSDGGLTAKELAKKLLLDETKTRHYNILQVMIEAGHVEKVEETKKHFITDFGKVHYGLSALEQAEKEPTESVETAPQVEKSVLTQNANEKINPNQESAMHDFEQHLEAEQSPLYKDTPQEEINETVKVDVELLPSLAKHQDVWSILDDAGSKIITALKKPKITNKENKIHLLRNDLVPMLDQRFKPLLLSIADDLEALA